MGNRYGPLQGVTNHYGTIGLGVLGSVIRATTATGTHGPGYIYPSLTSADDSKEIRGLILTRPSSGVLFPYEDGSFTLTGAAEGNYAFTSQLYVDGVATGIVTSQVTIGSGSSIPTLTGAVAGSAPLVGRGAVLGYMAGDDIPIPVVVGFGARRRVEVAYTGQRSAPQFFDYQEIDPIAFDFSNLLLEGETIASATAVITLTAGVDPYPNRVVIAEATPVGQTVVQWLQGTALNTSYRLRVVAMVNTGRRLVGSVDLVFGKR